MEAQPETGGYEGHNGFRDQTYFTSAICNEKIVRSKSFDCDSVKSLTVENLREKIRKSKSVDENYITIDSSNRICSPVSSMKCEYIY